MKQWHNNLIKGPPVSFRGAGEAREPGIQEHRLCEPRSRPVFMVSRPALRASRNDSVGVEMKRNVIGLMLSLTAVGCAGPDNASDNDKRGVFYGGVAAGGARP